MRYLLVLIGLFVLDVSGVRATVIPDEPEHVVSLNGPWRFKLERGGREGSPTTAGAQWNARHPIETPEKFEPFFALDYREDEAWHDLQVPGNWEIAGDSPATYGQPDNASGFYRREFDVPGEWRGRMVKINFDGVQNGAEVWLNGQPVKVTEPSWGRENYHESGWTAWQADLTGAVKFGEKNLLAIRVTKNTKSADLDSGDYFFLGGIHRAVTLFSVPKTHVRDFTVRTWLMENGNAKVELLLDVDASPEDHASVSARLEGVDGPEMSSGVSGVAEMTQMVAAPRLWSAETPNLYTLIIELKDNEGKTIERVKRRIGIREVTIKDGVLLLNGTPIKLAGICRHEVYPSKGTAVDEEVWRKDLELMRAANINCVRTSHYPYGSGFYDLCDEMGFYVVDELPYCWCSTREPELYPAYLQRARETIARDKNHACAIIWGIGNENQPGPALQQVADLVKQLDPTRPRLVSCQPAEKFAAELSDSHYTVPAEIEKSAERAKKNGHPHMYTENPNVWDVRLGADPGCWDAWAAVMQRTWNVVAKNDTIVGTCPWEWQDRAVADKSPIKLFEFDPASGISYFKIKGIVDGWRHPRPEHYHLKMIYSPIKVEKMEIGGDAVVLTMWNHYSFTDLSELKTTWKLMRSGQTIESDSITLKLPARSEGKLGLPFPHGAMAKADTLRIDFDHPDGRNVVSYEYPLKDRPATTALEARLPEGLKFPRLNLVVNVTKGDKPKWRVITRTRALLLNVEEQPLNAARAIDADIAMEDDPRTVVGKGHAEFVDNSFSYRIDWSGRQADIQELGWTFEMPHEFERFSWDREALWSVYPETHIGRARGTATPDSAQVPLTDIRRPDAFDFVSTKYQCNFASLTDTQGRGLRVEFAPEQRHQVKGGIASDGKYLLVVNRQCSPPRDISSATVADLYLRLSAGKWVEGSFRVGSNAVAQP